MKFIGIAIFLSVCIRTFDFLEINGKVPDVKKIVPPGAGVAGPIQTEKPVTFGLAECEKCTKNMTKNMEYLLTIAKSFNFSEFTKGKVPLCHKCEAKGLETISLYGDSCANVKPNDPNFTFTKTNFQWKYMTVTCECTLATNPTGLLKQLQFSSATCPDGTTTMVPPPDVAYAMKLTDLAACTPPLGVEIPETQNVIITMNRDNVKGSITVQKNMKLKGPNSVTVVAGGIIERDMNSLSATCKSNSTAYNMCNCLYSNHLTITILEQLIGYYTQCVNKSDDKYFKSILASYNVCNA